MRMPSKSQSGSVTVITCSFSGLLVGYFGPAFQPVEGRGLLSCPRRGYGSDGRVGKPVECGAEALVVLHLRLPGGSI